MDEQFGKTLLDEQQVNPIPAPPQKEVEIRTLQSDLQAFKDSGGEVPLSGERHAFASKEEPVVAGVRLNRRAELESGQIIQPVSEGAQPKMEAAIGKPATIKTVAIIILALAVIGGMGYIGYAYIFPVIFK